MARRVAILGAGVAGLAMAFALSRRGVDVVVIEEGSEAGGTVRTLRMHGCVVDAGPEAIVTTRPEALAMCTSLGLADRMIAPSDHAPTWLATRSGMAPLPEGLATGVPRSITQLATTPLLSWRGKLRASLDLVLPAGKREASLGGLVEQRLGREVRERLVEPIFGGIYGSDVARLEASFVAPHLASAPRSLIRVMARGRRSPTNPLRAPIDGMGSVVNALVASVGWDRVRVGAAARTIRRTHRGWRIEARGGASTDADDIVFATPPDPASAIARSLDAALADALATLRTHSTASVVLGFDARDVQLPRAGGVCAPRGDAGVLLGATIVSNRWPSSAPDGTVLLRALVGGERAPDLVESGDDGAIARAALGALYALLPLPVPRWSHVTRFARSQVFPEVGHRARVAQVRQRARALGSLHFVGAAYDGGGIAGILACAERTATELLS